MPVSFHIWTGWIGRSQWIYPHLSTLTLAYKKTWSAKINVSYQTTGKAIDVAIELRTKIMLGQLPLLRYYPILISGKGALTKNSDNIFWPRKSRQKYGFTADFTINL